MKIKEMKATKFRIILLVVMTIGIIASIAATYIGQTIINNNSENVIRAVSEEYSSKNRLQQLQTAKSVLDKQTDSIEKSRKIAADGTDYAYQQQLITDINRYAQKAGITVTGYSFPEPATDATGGATTTTPDASAQAGAGATTTPDTSAGAGAGVAAGTSATTGTPAGMQKITVAVSFVSPIEYTTLLRFLQILDTSLPKISTDTLQLDRSETNPNEVSMSSINLEVYIKK